MGKILVFIITVPFICFLLYKAVFFYEYDTRQRYLKDLLDNTAYKVKITGVLTSGDYAEIEQKLSSLGIENREGEGLVIEKGSFSEGKLLNMIEYIPGEFLEKGDAFMLRVVSSNPCRLSIIFNGNTTDVGKHLYYKAKAFCRIERDRKSVV